jgi:shikimate dehydrogenase
MTNYSISGTSQLLGIIGDPIEHSQSPIMQNAALAELGLDYVYIPFHVKPADLPTALAGLAALGVVGFNATIPHKQAIIPLLDRISPLAESVGAVNTVYRQEGGWYGTNTDVDGFISPLKHLDRSSGQTAVILGSGGASRAAVAGCHRLGYEHIVVIGRDFDRLVEFQQSWLDSPLHVAIHTALWSDLPGILPQADLLVNTTPLGMYPQVHDTPIDRSLMALCPDRAIVYDLIYKPSPTQFLSLATERRLEAIDGREMLINQGATALGLWLNQEISPRVVSVMRSSLS